MAQHNAPRPSLVWMKSVMTQEQIQALVNRGLLSPFGILTGDFFCRLLHYYKIKLVEDATQEDVEVRQVVPEDVVVEDEAEEGTKANCQQDDPPRDDAPSSHQAHEPNATTYTDAEVEEDDRKDRKALSRLQEGLVEHAQKRKEVIFHCDCFRERASHLEVELEKAKTDFRNLQAHQDIEVAVHDAIMKIAKLKRSLRESEDARARCQASFVAEKEIINSELANSKSREARLQPYLKECEDSNVRLQEQHNAIVKREYTVSQKLVYEANAHRDLERCLEEAVGNLQNDQNVIAGLEFELEELQKYTGYVIDMIQADADPIRPTPLLDRLKAAPDLLKKLLKDTVVECLKTTFALLVSHFLTTPFQQVTSGIAADFEEDKIP
ncbi:uncharacterized protein LOC106804462 [Setaria italica]|uniref:uncharacterized protein LOC106804462 n=1 Tax=Setaria italica TaxID=4555 RepID=UPI0007199E06|nr:uncharacterized protein LOC106804462 [Setaria italica]